MSRDRGVKYTVYSYLGSIRNDLKCILFQDQRQKEVIFSYNGQDLIEEYWFCNHFMPWLPIPLVDNVQRNRNETKTIYNQHKANKEYR